MIAINEILAAYNCIKGVVEKTPLQKSEILSERYSANIYLKREDQQMVRSYKIRGAYYKIASLSDEDRHKGVVCASAGNHAQGVAYACNHLNIKGKIFMPTTTPKQKVKQVRMFGRDHIEIILTGDTYDEAYHAAMEDCRESGSVFIHPFDDTMVIAGQGTMGIEIMEQIKVPLDMIFIPVGGGGLIAGLGSYLRIHSPSTRIIGVEPEGAPSMTRSLKKGRRVTLEKFEKFVDGAAVATIGELNFKIASEVIDDMLLVPEGKVCTSILQLYNESAIVVEPAGALSVAALDLYADQIKGKNVICIISGGNNDITRTEEIKERSLLYEGLKHYFIIRFPQRSGALRDFVNHVLGPEDDITRFEYIRKNSRENGPALVGIETRSRQDYYSLVKRMDEYRINYTHVNDSPDLFHFLI
ncbi:threonine ammonia-lyase IlvA [Xiashengella succiniciproducens]|uniref:L-threonine dehydratase n=1 Tax=Xiashengella succiniciproducens TaxID=2949635 RepID=A0A9J6ZRP4_9BACT|nr:threonine ammonia-lyase IlvA [Alkaliflexus sp. Ai-910]URW80254.1 threonine ammonia-lyase IlvA [Alkaliflexus sp. Ai-910]